MAKGQFKIACDFYDLIEDFHKDLKEYFQEGEPPENWEDDILTKLDELQKEAHLLIETTHSSYGK
jgi:hypothetical protein